MGAGSTKGSRAAKKMVCLARTGDLRGLVRLSPGVPPRSAQTLWCSGTQDPSS
jgi:hypothetical protein